MEASPINFQLFDNLLSLFLSVDEKQLDKDNLLCNADNEGSTLLHLAVDSGIPQVSACAALEYCVMADLVHFSNNANHLS